jgi:hypothetical protein
MNICPYCTHSNPKGATTCENCHKKMYTQPQTEWRSHIDQLAQDYRTGHAKGLVHGLQKDGIQNGWGARQGNAAWGFEFALITSSDNIKYLTMTDWGTTGLTGTVYEDPESIPDNLPPDERLARFENMNFSGGNQGPGLYGRGKLLFQAASQRGSIIYDSLTINGEYRLGIRFQDGRRLQQFPKAVEGQAAVEMLGKQTNGTLIALTRPGTRVTIIEPLEEIVESMLNGSFLHYIQETWWEILFKQKENIEICVSVNSDTHCAECPPLLQKLASGQMPQNMSYRVENQVVSVKGHPYRVKRLVFGKMSQVVPEELRGLYVQRKGMKVGTVELRDMPSDLGEHFIGFIELDKEYEEEIAKAEDLTHYSFSGQFGSYRELKKFAQYHFDEFKKQLGYDVEDNKTADQKAREALRSAHEKLNHIMQDLGLKGIGVTHSAKKEIEVSLANVDFPTPGSNRVEMNDVIANVRFRVANRSKYDYDLKIVLETRRTNGAVIQEICASSLDIKHGAEIELAACDIRISPELYPKYEQINCVCRVKSATDELMAQTRFPIFIGIDPPEEIQEPVQIRIAEIEFPRTNSIRVNYSEEIKNTRFTIKNNTLNPLNLRAVVVTLDPQYENQEIENLLRQDIHLNPLSEQDISIPSIRFEENIYRIVHEGMIKLRCRATSTKDQHDIEKGRKWVRDVMIWLNKDAPGFGIFEDIEYFNGGAESPRSKAKQGSMQDRWIFQLNLTHPQYDAVESNGQNREAYIFELMAREALYIALHSENFEPFNNALKQEDEPHAVSKEYNVALDKVLAAYYES